MSTTLAGAKIDAFAGDIVQRLAAAWTIAAIHVGDRLGLYAALTEEAARPSRSRRESPPTPASPASGSTAKWRPASSRSTNPTTAFLRSAAVLAVQDSPAFLAGAGGVLAAVFHAEARITAAFRGDGKLAWADQAPCLFAAVDRSTSQATRASLVANWIPTSAAGAHRARAARRRVPELDVRRHRQPRRLPCPCQGTGRTRRRRRQRQAPARRCGVVWRRTIRPDLFPRRPPRRRRSRRGDLPRTDQLGADGSIMLVEPAAREHVVDAVGNLAAQLYHPGSAFLCTPNALAQGATALGNQVPEAVWRDLFTRAGSRRSPASPRRRSTVSSRPAAEVRS